MGITIIQFLRLICHNISMRTSQRLSPAHFMVAIHLLARAVRKYSNVRITAILIIQFLKLIYHNISICTSVTLAPAHFILNLSAGASLRLVPVRNIVAQEITAIMIIQFLKLIYHNISIFTSVTLAPAHFILNLSAGASLRLVPVNISQLFTHTKLSRNFKIHLPTNLHNVVI